MQLNPCLIFSGSAEEALEFYRDALGGKVEIARYKDSPAAGSITPDWGDKVLYGTLTSPFGVVAAMDAPKDRAGTPGDNFGITVIADSDKDAAASFTKLSDGGSVIMPYEETFWAAKFGMVQDKFGIKWMVNYRLAPIYNPA